MAQIVVHPGNLNKKTLADQFAARSDVSSAAALDFMETLFDIIGQTVAAGGTVAVTNFGTWSRPNRSARMVRNPQTGNKFMVPEQYGIKFAVSPRLVQYANSGNPSAATIRKLPKGPPVKRVDTLEGVSTSSRHEHRSEDVTPAVRV